MECVCLKSSPSRNFCKMRKIHIFFGDGGINALLKRSERVRIYFEKESI